LREKVFLNEAMEKVLCSIVREEGAALGKYVEGMRGGVSLEKVWKPLK